MQKNHFRCKRIMNIKTYSNKTTHFYLFILGIYYLEIVQISLDYNQYYDVHNSA